MKEDVTLAYCIFLDRRAKCDREQQSDVMVVYILSEEPLLRLFCGSGLSGRDAKKSNPALLELVVGGGGS